MSQKMIELSARTYQISKSLNYVAQPLIRRVVVLDINKRDIRFAQTAKNKTDALTMIVHDLISKGCVDSGYLKGVFQREAQGSTYLGHGIAIPHGTVETRSKVKKTGLSIFHFADGINWDNGQTVHLVIGIAAKSDEHLDILKRLTHLLSDKDIDNNIASLENIEQIVELLSPTPQSKAECNPSLIKLNFPASDIVQITAVAGGLLKHAGHIGSRALTDMITQEPIHLGKGLWLVSSSKQVTHTAVSVVTTVNDCQYNNHKVKGLIAIAACNQSHLPILENISKSVFEGQHEDLFNSSTNEIIEKLTGDKLTTVPEDMDHNEIFTIHNAHGLHARPSAVLVAEAKKFEATILVSNLNGSEKVVNAKSLMKVITLGVKCGHQLKFSAQGPDSKQAILSIGAVIKAGLGEH